MCLNKGCMNKVSESNVMEGAKEETKLMWERNVSKISVHPDVGKSTHLHDMGTCQHCM